MYPLWSAQFALLGQGISEHYPGILDLGKENPLSCNSLMGSADLQCMLMGWKLAVGAAEVSSCPLIRLCLALPHIRNLTLYPNHAYIASLSLDTPTVSSYH